MKERQTRNINNHANQFIAIHNHYLIFVSKYGCKYWMHKLPDGKEVGVAPVTGATETASTFTGLWFEGKFAIPERLKAPRASLKPSDIKIRKWVVLTSSGGSAALLFRFPYNAKRIYQHHERI